MTEVALLEFDTHKDQHLFPATINFGISIKVLLPVTNLNIFDEQNPLIIRVVFCSKSLVWSEGLLSSSQNVNISMSHPRHLQIILYYCGTNYIKIYLRPCKIFYFVSNNNCVVGLYTFWVGFRFFTTQVRKAVFPTTAETFWGSS